jgi:hypothetical protein
MHRHAGEIVHFNDIAADIHLEPDKVAAAMVRMTNAHPEYGVSRTTRGFYIFRVADVDNRAPVEPEKRAPMMYEEVGTTQAGAIVVRDEKGMLYRLDGAL